MIVERDYEKEKVIIQSRSSEPTKVATSSDIARKVSWVVAVIILILSVFIAIVCTAIYNEQPSLPLDYDYVIQNWQQQPIYSITPSANGCSEYFTSFQYPGTVDGCDCTSSPSTQFANNIYASQCSTLQLTNGCKSVNSTPQQTFTQWQLYSTILQLCVTRIQGFNYMDSDCNIVGYRRCGVSSTDTTNPNMFCLPSTTQCPINSIVYGATAPDNTYISIINVGTQKIFTSNAVINNQPLAFSHISRGNGECSDFSNYHYIDPTMTEYLLMRGRSSTCTLTQTDTRFKEIFQITESTYFSANGFTSSSLPSYPLSQNMQYYFLTRSYIPWQQLGTCRYTHMPYFINLRDKMNNVSNLWVGCIIVNWFVAVLYGGLASTLRLKLNWRIKDWVIIPTVLLLIIQIIMTVITFVYAVDTHQKISNMSDAQCSDIQTNSFITNFSSKYTTSVFNYQIVLLVFVLVLMLFSIFFMKTIFLLVRKPKAHDEMAQSQTSSKALIKNSSDKKQDYENGLLEDRAQVVGGFDNTYQPNNQDGHTMYPNHEGASENFSNNLNNGTTINQETIIKANEDLESNKQKGVLKNTNQQQQGKQGQQNGNLKNNGNSNIKVTKFEDNLNSDDQRKKELDNLYAEIASSDFTNTNKNGAATTTGSLNPNNNNNAAKNNLNTSNLPNKSSNSKTNLAVIRENLDDGNPIFGSVKETNKSKVEMQLQVISRDGQSDNEYKPSQQQLPTSAYLGLPQSQDQQQIKSLANMEGLLDREDWEFEIDDYVRKHRENQQNHSRIGGGYDIGKPREKYLQHKFLKSHTRRGGPSQPDFDNELSSPEKNRQNAMTPEMTHNNFPSNAQLNENQEIMTENGDDNLQKLP